MNTKKKIAYLLQHQATKENIHYQKIRKLYWSDIRVNSVKLTEYMRCYELEIKFLSDVKTFWLCKWELDFGKIIMTKFCWKVDPLLTIVWIVRIKKSDLGDLSEDFLHSQENCDKDGLNKNGILTNPSPWLLKEQGSY